MRQPPGPDDPTTVGRFRIVGVLGAGGMGRVLLGESPDGRLAAVKLVHAELTEDDGFRARFRREVRLAAQAPPGWTAPFLDADPDAPQPWLATAFLDAPSLLERLTEHGPYPPASAAELGTGLAAALSALHSAGLVHRDLKPSNVLLTDGGPRLIDFGISRAVDGTALTATGQSVGTPEYMSPEQVIGADAGPPSDVFSLGTLLTFAVRLRTPFAAGSPTGALYRVVHDEPDLPDQLGPLRPVLRACLDKEPGRRPTAPQVRDRLAEIAAGRGENDGAAAAQGRDARRTAGGDGTAVAPGPVADGPARTSAFAFPPDATPEHGAPPDATAEYGAPRNGTAADGAAPGPSGPPWTGPADGAASTVRMDARRPAPTRYPPPAAPPPRTRVAPAPRPAAGPGRDRRRWLLVGGAVLLAVLVGVGGTLGVLALRPDPATPTTPVAGATTGPAAPPSTAASTSARPADLTAGATVVDTSQDVRYGAASDSLRFASPSGNIACMLSGFEVRCDVAEKTWQVPPRPASCQLAFGPGVELAGSAAANLVCAGDTVADASLPPLDYGRALRTREIVCVSREDGVECRNSSTGHGFVVSRTAYRLY